MGSHTYPLTTVLSDSKWITFEIFLPLRYFFRCYWNVQADNWVFRKHEILSLELREMAHCLVLPKERVSNSTLFIQRDEKDFGGSEWAQTIFAVLTLMAKITCRLALDAHGVITPTPCSRGHFHVRDMFLARGWHSAARLNIRIDVS